MKYALNRHCLKCQKRIIDHNKSGFCNSHRDRTGKNNSFYGKTFKPETLIKMGASISKATTKKWLDPEYRRKVIAGTSKPRKASFGPEQSRRIMKWYADNPDQRTSRSKSMRKKWQNGTIVKNGYSCNSSKLEKRVYLDILAIVPNAEFNHTIRDDTSWYFPDIWLPSEGIAIEVYGDYWHANPEKYKTDDKLHHGITAGQIWVSDRTRLQKIEKCERVTSVLVIWESDYKTNPTRVLSELDARINYEFCY